jgi:hypothetical protein
MKEVGDERGNRHQELAGIRPGRAAEALEGDEAASLEEGGAVDDIGGLLAVLRDDAVGGEAVGGGLEVVEGVLAECRDRVVGEGVVGSPRGGGSRSWRERK